MAAPRFLCKTELAGLSRVALAGRPVLADHETLRAAIGERAPGAAGLLAEPVASATAISWYAEGNGEAVPLTALSPARRAEAERQLGAAIAALQPVLDDPGLGPLARRALVLPEADRIMLLDERPVLTGWGLAPAERAATAAGLAEQVRAVLGRHVPALSGTDSTFFATTPAAAPPPPAATPAQPPVPAAPPPPAVPPPPPPPPPTPPPIPAPGPAGGRGWWMLPAALAIAIVFLLLGFLLAWRIVAGSGGQTLNAALLDEGRTRAQIEMQRQTNAALEAEIQRARQALQGNICRPEAPLSPGQLPPALTPVPPSALPPPAPAQPPPGQPVPGQQQPGQQPGQQPPGQQQGQAAPAQPFRGNLAQLLDQGTVLIIGFGERFRGHGTGFFVAPGLVLTNAHVARPDARLFVLNKGFPRPLEAQIVASTRDAGAEPEPMARDFALLRVEGAPALQPLGLTTVAEKLQDVVAAGFPAQIVEMDENMTALLQGQQAAVPDLVLTTGVISAIQHAPTGLVVMPHTASVSPGNSGGPLVDRCGRVVGVNTFVRRAEGAADRVNYAQKSDEALAFLQSTGAVAITPLAGECQPQAPGAQALPPAPPGAPPAAPGATPPPGGGSEPPAAPPPAAPAAPAAPR